MDLLSVLPGFVTKPYAHILPPLERNGITTVDLITLDTLEIAKRAHVPPADVRRLCVRVIAALHTDLGFEKTETSIDDAENEEPSSSINQNIEILAPGPANRLDPASWNLISTMDPAMDALLGGGIPTGYVTEVTGESGSGKTQFLLSLLLGVQLAKPHGLEKRAIYVSTEHPLATNRLEQMIECHPYLSNLPADQKPALKNVLAINAMDLETQDHILNYQLPVAIERYNAGLVIIDSITSNYRAEHSNTDVLSLAARSTELAKLGQMLRNLAAKENIAIVVANQVSDRFDNGEVVINDIAQLVAQGLPSSQGNETTPDSRGVDSPLSRSRTELLAPPTQQSQSDDLSSSLPLSQLPPPEDEQFEGTYLFGNPPRIDMMSLFHQERFFTGWGDNKYVTTSLKTPALGFFWSTQVACRIALKKQTRSMFNPWDGGFPLSTPLEQMAPQEEKVEEKVVEAKPGFSSARTHTGESQSQSEPQPESQPEEVKEEKPDVEPSPPPGLSNSPVLPESEQITKRIMKVAFAPWTAGPEKSEGSRTETAFEIWKGGLRSIESDEW